jgi:hypothetical protein
MQVYSHSGQSLLLRSDCAEKIEVCDRQQGKRVMQAFESETTCQLCHLQQQTPNQQQAECAQQPQQVPMQMPPHYAMMQRPRLPQRFFFNATICSGFVPFINIKSSTSATTKVALQQLYIVRILVVRSGKSWHD